MAKSYHTFIAEATQKAVAEFAPHQKAVGLLMPKIVAANKGEKVVFTAEEQATLKNAAAAAKQFENASGLFTPKNLAALTTQINNAKGIQATANKYAKADILIKDPDTIPVMRYCEYVDPKCTSNRYFKLELLTFGSGMTSFLPNRPVRFQNYSDNKRGVGIQSELFLYSTTSTPDSDSCTRLYQRLLQKANNGSLTSLLIAQGLADTDKSPAMPIRHNEGDGEYFVLDAESVTAVMYISEVPISLLNFDNLVILPVFTATITTQIQTYYNDNMRMCGADFSSFEITPPSVDNNGRVLSAAEQVFWFGSIQNSIITALTSLGLTVPSNTDFLMMPPSSQAIKIVGS